MDLSKIYALASQGATPNKPYPSELPEQLAPWHVYFADAGHSILCVVGERWAKLLERSVVEEDVAELFASVSVKTLLRAGWDIHPRFEVIVARDVEYDPMYGVITPSSDEEF
jgi:hypothetical protein